MKQVTVTEAQASLPQLIKEACNGDVVVLSDGDKLVRLEPYDPSDPRVYYDLEEDSPELEAELLKAVEGPHKPYSAEEMRETLERIIREERTRTRLGTDELGN